MPDPQSPATLLGTQNYALFQTAEQLGRTVRELMTGQPGPLTACEQLMWQRFRLATARLQQQVNALHKRV